MRSGVWLIEPHSGRMTGALEFVRGGREVFDVVFISGRRPSGPAAGANLTAPPHRGVM
jgi:hypothetical protein